MTRLTFPLPQAFAEEDRENPPEVWAHHTLPREMKVQLHSFARVIRQFGLLLPEKAFINIALGKRPHFGSVGIVQPTRLLYKEQEDVKIAGGLFLMSITIQEFSI